MRQLIIIQEKEEDCSDTTPAKVAGDGIRRKLNERLPTNIRSRKHRLSDEEKALMDAIHDLRALLRLLTREKSLVLPSTSVTYEKLGNGEFKGCKPGDLEFPGESDVHEDLFKQVWSLFMMIIVPIITSLYKPKLAIIKLSYYYAAQYQLLPPRNH